LLVTVNYKLAFKTNTHSDGGRPLHKAVMPSLRAIFTNASSTKQPTTHVTDEPQS